MEVVEEFGGSDLMTVKSRSTRFFSARRVALITVVTTALCLPDAPAISQETGASRGFGMGVRPLRQDPSDHPLMQDPFERLAPLLEVVPRVERRQEAGGYYYNSLTDEFFMGNRVFHSDDHEAAIATQGQRNTRSPSGVGWRRISETDYVNYMRMVRGLDTPMDQTIYNNCVVARSRGASESVMREVRASCRETARNPSRLERWRWGD